MKNDTAGEKKKNGKNTLDAVSRKAMAEPEFWSALRRNRKKALADAGFVLDARDYARLEAIMATDGKTFTVDLDEVMSRIHEQRDLESVGAGEDGGVAGFGGLTWVGMWGDPESNVRPDPGNPGVKKPR
jgi:hypothetical protein